MTNHEDSDYYARREAQQRTLAAKAHSPDIRRIHLDLADGYAERAGTAAGPRPRPKLSIVTPA